MFNNNPYLNYYKNNPNYYKYNNPTFFNIHSMSNFNQNKSAKMYNFANDYSKYYNNPKKEETSDNFKNCTQHTNEEKTRFSIGNFSITDRGINAFGYHLNFDDLIIILLILFLYFETDTDLSVIIVLGLMLFNINLSTIKNIF